MELDFGWVGGSRDGVLLEIGWSVADSVCGEIGDTERIRLLRPLSIAGSPTIERLFDLDVFWVGGWTAAWLVTGAADSELSAVLFFYKNE
jgi:hypothetical protein